MEQISTNAIIFIILGWGFVLSLISFSMYKVLTDKTEYEQAKDSE